MTLLPLPAFDDNYIWLVHNGRQCLAVDPGDAKPVLQALGDLHLTLSAILVTHHHADHVGGLADLVQATGAPVYGPAGEDIPGSCLPCTQGDVVSLLGVDFQVLDVPGHTAGHIAFFGLVPDQDPLLFCGDTLFSGGCGRLFEGTPAQMLASLDKLAALPGTTRVCCAHEYTLGNLKFARAVEPNNKDLQHYEAQCQDLRKIGQATLPSNVALERQINPFLRSRENTVREGLRERCTHHDDVEVFAALRRWKSEFK